MAAQALPDIDVIILSWNRADDTIAAIASAARQVDVNVQIQIVDQGSDATNLKKLEDYLRGVPAARLHKLPKNVGVAAGRNIATGMGRAPYVVALDSDAEFADERALSKVIVQFQSNARLCAMGFRIDNFFTGEYDKTSWDYPGAHSPDQHFAASRFIGAGHAIRRDVFDVAGGYDERLFFCGEELDLCYRMLNTGHRIAYVPDIVVRHKVSPEHRVFWGKGRYYYTVRNNLYTSCKFGIPPSRIAVSAAAFLVKGLRNGMLFATLRAFRDSARMVRTFRASAEDKRLYTLSADTWAYILQCEPSRRDGMVQKIRRQFAMLPHQS